MKHILKFIVGFSFVMACLLLVVVVVNFGWYVFYTMAFVLAILICYKIGSDIWDTAEEVIEDRNNR